MTRKGRATKIVPRKGGKAGGLEVQKKSGARRRPLGQGKKKTRLRKKGVRRGEKGA